MKIEQMSAEHNTYCHGVLFRARDNAILRMYWCNKCGVFNTPHARDPQLRAAFEQALRDDVQVLKARLLV